MTDAAVTTEKPWTGMEAPDGHERGPLEHFREPRPCTMADLATVKEDMPAEMLEDLNAYFDRFAAPIRDGEKWLCFHCGEVLARTLVDSFLSRGGFEWGLTHGMGHCRCCRWPAALYHFVKDRHGEDLVTLRGVCLSFRPKTEAEMKEEETMLDVERLVGAAIIRAGVEHTGFKSHSEIRRGLGDADAYKPTDGDQEGFITSTGRFVDRLEAIDIGVAAGQCLPMTRPLLSSDIDKW